MTDASIDGQSEASATQVPGTADAATEPAVRRKVAEGGAAVVEAAHATVRVARRVTGVVVSNKANKTIGVRIERRVKHPVYGKFVRRSTQLAVHDEHNDCRVGDVVAIIETRPIAKTKSWRLDDIVERANSVGG